MSFRHQGMLQQGRRGNVSCPWGVAVGREHNLSFCNKRVCGIIIEILSHSKSILGLDIIDSISSLVQLYKVKTNINFKKKHSIIPPLESNGFEPF